MRNKNCWLRTLGNGKPITPGGWGIKFIVYPYNGMKPYLPWTGYVTWKKIHLPVVIILRTSA